MTYPDHLGHPDICAGVDHPIVTVSVHWCPHRQAWTVSLTGGQADLPLICDRIDLGPFDGTSDAIALAQLQLASMVQAIGQGASARS